MVTLTSTITCPKCRFTSKETMATDACQFFYECKGCDAMLKPLPGDCCVYCSYGDTPCPPVQEQRCGCRDRLHDRGRRAG
ncbi:MULTISPECIES: GDCCVxC domain-containing (seleno)protein [unclassified Sinorhizobium]|uniref:GDCCVxC domain-containing (seleno)protein n=1 Tax=unclassified Sinorhizobium TaxID=2613772 RepID=UPI003523E0F3